MSIQVKALAKVNLFLHVLGKRTDGYHILDSMIAFAQNLYDTMTLAESKQDEIVQTHNSKYAVDGPNILEKTLHALRSVRKIPHFKITLEKHIPIGAGLGGGSSDASQLIAHLNTYFDLKLSDAELLSLCKSLGADVFPCLSQKALYFTGTGEIVEHISQFPEIYAVLVYPDKQVNTRDIYSLGFNKFRTKLSRVQKFPNIDELFEALKPQCNDFLANTKQQLPELDEIIRIIETTKNCNIARMSGSGSTCFGLFKNKNDAEASSLYLQEVFPCYAVYATQLV